MSRKETYRSRSSKHESVSGHTAIKRFISTVTVRLSVVLLIIVIIVLLALPILIG
ncbi:MAG: hypothetical protein JSW54_01480 [Fidelibacterota bacterium]|nr:MAG: hypothetical protein JSW54_01480 [Candidatus Neomarinimicrobiota bacterium]